MKTPLNLRATSVLLSMLLLLVTACDSMSTTSPPLRVQPPAIQPLAANARQAPPPPECSPTCLEGLTRARKSTHEKLTQAAAPASSASAATTR